MSPNDAKKMIDRALTSVRQALRGKLQRASGAKRVIRVQSEGLKGEPFNAMELFQQPGLRSVPIAGMQTIIIPLNGRSANGVVVAMSNGALYVTDLQPGEVALFNENEGEANSIVMRNGKVIDMTCDVLNIKATTAINIDTPLLQNTGDIKAGTISVTHHKHGGVSIGGALTDVPE